jgi:hypothetical protein
LKTKKYQTYIHDEPNNIGKQKKPNNNRKSFICYFSFNQWWPIGHGYFETAAAVARRSPLENLFYVP